MTEVEKKYVIDGIKNEVSFQRDQLVFQWYEERSEFNSSKVKVIFDFTKIKIICVRIYKMKCGIGVNEKQVEYLNVNEVDFSKYIGVPFVEKRRGINGNVFIDHFLKSNLITEYLMEIEEEEKIPQYAISPREVTGDAAYDNANMSVPFDESDFFLLKSLFDLWLI